MRPESYFFFQIDIILLLGSIGNYLLVTATLFPWPIINLYLVNRWFSLVHHGQNGKFCLFETLE